MKTKPIILCLAALTVGWTAAQEPFTYETAERFGSIGDFNGDGRRDAAIVDRLTGDVRIAFQQVSGTFLWSAPQPGGIESPQALAVGRFYGVDAMAIGSDLSNRVHLISLGSAGEIVLPTPYYPSAPGPSAMAAIDIDAANTIDLVTVGEVLAPTANFGKGKILQGMVNLIGTPATLWSTSYGNVSTRLNPARLKTGAAQRLCRIFHAAGSTSATLLIETVGTGGLSSSIVAAGLASDTRYVPTSLDGGALTQFLFWDPNSPFIRIRRIQEPSAGTFTLGAQSVFDLGSGIQTVTPIPQGATGRVAILFSNGTVGLYSFNGSSAPVHIQSLAGAGHEMVLPLENGSFLVGSGLRGATPTWKRFNASGGTYVEAFGGSLEAAVSSRSSNVLFLSAEPFVNPGAEIRQLTRFRDWTTLATLSSGSAWNVRSQAFNSTGLTNTPDTVTLSGTTTSDYPLVNQYAPGISIRVLSSTSGVQPADVVFSPAPGTYDPPATDHTSSVTVGISATTPGHYVYYRRNSNSAFSLITIATKIEIVQSTVFEAYSQHPQTGVRSPMRKASYVIAEPSLLSASAPVDLDGDGMADLWERTFGITNPTADADGDGVDNLSEYIAGTDPRDAASAPPAALALKASTVSNAGTNYLRLEWQDPAAVLKKSPDLVSWGAHGAVIQTIPGGFRADIPMTGAVPTRAFYRLEK